MVEAASYLERRSVEMFGVVAPLSLVLLPGGDVVRVRVGQARQHHVALLLLLPPRLGHCLSQTSKFDS